MKLLDMFIIVIVVCIGMFGFIYISANSTSPANVTDTFGHTSANNATNASYGLAQNVSAIETQGSTAGLLIVAICVVLIIIFALVVLTRGKYSKNKYRT